jgi:hypothetical protein
MIRRPLEDRTVTRNRSLVNSSKRLYINQSVADGPGIVATVRQNIHSCMSARSECYIASVKETVLNDVVVSVIILDTVVMDVAHVDISNLSVIGCVLSESDPIAIIIDSHVLVDCPRRTSNRCGVAVIRIPRSSFWVISLNGSTKHAQVMILVGVVPDGKWIVSVYSAGPDLAGSVND